MEFVLFLFLGLVALIAVIVSLLGLDDVADLEVVGPLIAAIAGLILFCLCGSWLSDLL